MESGKKKIEWLEFNLLETFPHVAHGVFLRHGGESQGKFSSLNLSESVGDHPDAVKLNREAVRKTLGLSKILFAQQTHGTNVHRITSKNGERTPLADALFTTEKNIGLAVTHADCQAAIFYDPVHEAIAVAHAGWKGSAHNIYARVVNALHQEVGTQAHNLIVCISPSLGSDHAEYKNYRQELPQELWGFQTQQNHFDFWEISRSQLAACGVPEKNIEISALCTQCHHKDYFSYRAEKETGRNATIVGLKE